MQQNRQWSMSFERAAFLNAGFCVVHELQEVRNPQVTTRGAENREIGSSVAGASNPGENCERRRRTLENQFFAGSES